MLFICTRKHYNRGGRASAKIVELHASECLDCLPCDAWEYFGLRDITADKLLAPETRRGMLALINHRQKATYTTLHVFVN